MARESNNNTVNKVMASHNCTGLCMSVFLSLSRVQPTLRLKMFCLLHLDSLLSLFLTPSCARGKVNHSHFRQQRMLSLPCSHPSLSLRSAPTLQPVHGPHGLLLKSHRSLVTNAFPHLLQHPRACRQLRLDSTKSDARLHFQLQIIPCIFF